LTITQIGDGLVVKRVEQSNCM